MKVLIHVGMPKTGTSSIQSAFSAIESESFYYVNWASSNHSALFVLLFHDEDKIADYHGFKARGEEFIKSLPSLRARWLESVSKDLDKSIGKTVLFSAEDICSGEFEAATERMREFFSRWTNDIKIVGYLRPPRSFAQSSFQEYLKGGTASSIRIEMIWPHYRARFEKFDRIFGRDNVELRVYRKELLKRGDIVSDFGSIIGVSAPVGFVVEENKSLSLEATALLFVQRSLGKGYVSGFPRAPVCNQKFIDILSKIGEKPLIFNSDFWDEVLKSFEEDVSWAENRVGLSLSEDRVKTDNGISGEADLIEVAKACFPDLIEVLADEMKSPTIKMPVIVSSIELLRAIAYNR